MQKVKVRYIKNGKEVEMQKRYADVLVKSKIVELVVPFVQTQTFEKINKPFAAPVQKAPESEAILLNLKDVGVSGEFTIKDVLNNEKAPAAEEKNKEETEEKSEQSIKPAAKKPASKKEGAWPATVENKAKPFSMKKSEE